MTIVKMTVIAKQRYLFLPSLFFLIVMPPNPLIKHIAKLKHLNYLHKKLIDASINSGLPPIKLKEGREMLKKRRGLVRQLIAELSEEETQETHREYKRRIGKTSFEKQRVKAYQQSTAGRENKRRFARQYYQEHREQKLRQQKEYDQSEKGQVAREISRARDKLKYIITGDRGYAPNANNLIHILGMVLSQKEINSISPLFERLRKEEYHTILKALYNAEILYNLEINLHNFVTIRETLIKAGRFSTPKVEQVLIAISNLLQKRLHL